MTHCYIELLNDVVKLFNSFEVLLFIFNKTHQTKYTLWCPPEKICSDFALLGPNLPFGKKLLRR